MLTPINPLPEPLRGADAGSFTEQSVLERLPKIANRTLDENDLDAERASLVTRIIGEIATGVIAHFNEPLSPDADAWAEYVSPYLGMSWLDVPWFFAEGYFYRRLLAATGFSQPGPRSGVDPFRPQKTTSLEAAAPLAPRLGYLLDDPARLLRASLWANRVDLSLWPAGEEAATARTAEVLGLERESHLMVDDTEPALAILEENRLNVHIILDNSGAELVADLALIASILRGGGQVTVHVKPHPTFVSDVTRSDFTETIGRLAREPDPAGVITSILTQGLGNGRLRTSTHHFWVSPLPFWQAPADLLDELAAADLVIVKGDYNYRRLLGDLHWDPTTPFQEVVRPLQPVLALRVAKSLTGAGIPASVVRATEMTDPDWMSDGQWGMIQLCPEIN